MPDPSDESAAVGDGLDRPAGDEGGAERRGLGRLDVPEWVSELRQLYVEPKTRAELRQEQAESPPPKRRPGLTGGRFRRGAARTAPSAAPPENQVVDAAAGGPPPAVEPVPAAAPVPRAPDPVLDGSAEPSAAPDLVEEAKVTSWLTSYLAATGLTTSRDAPGEEATPTEPSQVADPGVEDPLVHESHPLSLAELAARSEPEPASRPLDEPTPDEATPDEPTPDDAAPDEPTPDEATPDGPTPAEPTPDEPTPDEATPADEVSAPEQPESFESGPPGVEEPEQDVVVEAPSPLVAPSRRHGEDPVAEDEIELMVGVPRHPHRHLGRFDSAMDTIYIMHSQLCVERGPDHSTCPYVEAFRAGVDRELWNEWMDRAVVLGIGRSSELVPLQDADGAWT